MDSVKKILLLGGSAQQLVAIRKAKELGYYTVLCDYLPDNPGQYEADVFYLVSTTDKEKVLEVAKKEQVDGVVAYSSDPAAPTAAYVAEQMGLPGIPYLTAMTFCDKSLFRHFLKAHRFNTPKCVELAGDDFSQAVQTLQFPVIVKPTDSSGSKGVSVVRNCAELNDAIAWARQYSRNGKLLAEEFLERDHPDVIEAEIFVVDGKVAVWGLINSIRDKNTNPLLPAAYSYPLNISDERFALVKYEICRLVECGGIRYGAMNIEMLITKENRLYFLDVGPRNGGNMLPEYIGDIARADLVKATINVAMGEYDKLCNLHLDGRSGGYWGLSVIHTARSGRLENISFSQETKKYLRRIYYFKKSGESVSSFSQSRDALGLAFFCFPDRKTGREILENFEGKYVQIGIKNQD